MVLKTDENTSVSLSGVNLNHQQMSCLCNAFLSAFTLISPSVLFIRSFFFPACRLLLFRPLRLFVSLHILSQESLFHSAICSLHQALRSTG